MKAAAAEKRRRLDERMARYEAERAEARKRMLALADTIAEQIVGMKRCDVIDAIQLSLGGAGWVGNDGWGYNFVRPETLRLIRQLHARLINPVDLDAAPMRLVVAAREMLDAIPPFALGDGEDAWPCVKQAAQILREALDELELEP